MKEYDAVAVGKRLRRIRGVRTRSGVARETGISVTTLQGYENGTRKPKAENMVRLANYYGTSVQHLFFEEW